MNRAASVRACVTTVTFGVSPSRTTRLRAAESLIPGRRQRHHTNQEALMLVRSQAAIVPLGSRIASIAAHASRRVRRSAIAALVLVAPLGLAATASADTWGTFPGAYQDYTWWDCHIRVGAVQDPLRGYSTYRS